MSPNCFQHLVELVRPLITKKATKTQKAITAEERLAVTLCFLATGDSRQSFSFSFRMGKATVSNTETETSNAIYQVLKEKYLSALLTKEEWLKISQESEENWNMPQTIGCKQIRIVCLKLTGTLFSILLMAVGDANYCFTMIDLGQYGSNNDKDVLASSVMGEVFDDAEMNLPAPSKIYKSSDQDLPYFFLGDEIFPHKDWLMRSFPRTRATEEEKIYNYRHSKACCYIENAFGILSQLWKIFLKPIKASAKNVENYTLACLTLHNYLCLIENAKYTPTGFADSEDSYGNIVPGDWRKDVQIGNSALEDIASLRGSRAKKSALDTRDALKDFLNSEEVSVPWQVGYVRRTSHYAV